VAIRLTQRSTKPKEADDYCLLELSLPSGSTVDVNSAEQLIDSLGNQLLRRKPPNGFGRLADHISLEIAYQNGEVHFYIWAARYLRQVIAAAVNETYNEARLQEKPDYSRNRKRGYRFTAELTPKKSNRSDNDSQASRFDVLQSFIAYLQKLDSEAEELWLQLIIRPLPSQVGQGTSKLNYATKLFGRKSGTDGQTTVENLNLPFTWSCKFRLVYQGRDERTGRLQLKLLETILGHFRTARFNGLAMKDGNSSSDKQLEYHARFFIDRGLSLDADELGSLFNPAYLPHGEAPTDEPPQVIDAPSEIPVGGSGDEADLSLIGLTNVGGKQAVFGLKRQDRSRHVAIFGQPGMGKTSLMQLLILSDIYWNQGFAVFDPNGGLAEEIIGFIPKRRHQDVLYFNLNDVDWPVSFNPLNNSDPKLKGRIEVEIVGALRKLFGEDWSASVEYLLKEAVVALLDYPDATLLDINKFLREPDFRRQVVSHCQVEGTKNFWQKEFDSWSEENGSDYVSAIMARIGDFEADPIISSFISNPQSSFNLTELMDQGKIVVVNLARGIIGNEKALALGELLLSNLALSALGRVQTSDKKPFYVYIDDAQAIAGDNFITTLNEGKLLELNITVASEAPSAFSESLQQAINDHVDTYFCFNLKHDDAEQLERHYKPRLKAEDLSRQAPRNFSASIIVNNRKVPAFSAKSLNLPGMPDGNRSGVISASRERYARVKALLPASGTRLIKSALRLARKGISKDHMGKLALTGQTKKPKSK
jgi:hypothetical protein